MYIMSDILQEVLEEHFQQDPSPTDGETLQISEHPQVSIDLASGTVLGIGARWRTQPTRSLLWPYIAVGRVRK